MNPDTSFFISLISGEYTEPEKEHYLARRPDLQDELENKPLFECLITSIWEEAKVEPLPPTCKLDNVTIEDINDTIFRYYNTLYAVAYNLDSIGQKLNNCPLCTKKCSECPVAHYDNRCDNPYSLYHRLMAEANYGSRHEQIEVLSECLIELYKLKEVKKCVV